MDWDLVFIGLAALGLIAVFLLPAPVDSQATTRRPARHAATPQPTVESRR